MVLEGLRHNHSVTSINLSSNSLRALCADSLGVVLSNGLTPLVSLDVSGNNFDDKCISVRALPCCRPLLALLLRHRAACCVCCCSWFERVRVGCVQVVAAGLKGNTSLTHLDVRANEGLDIESADVAMIRKITRENELARRK